MTPDDGAPQSDPGDLEREEQRLEDLRRRNEQVARDAEADLEVGGPGRTFTDAGVRAQVDQDDDTHHPPADR